MRGHRTERSRWSRAGARGCSTSVEFRLIALDGQPQVWERRVWPTVRAHVPNERRETMSETEFFGDAIERLEWDERKEDDTPFKRWRHFTRRTALTGGAAGIAAMVLEACGSSSSSSSSAASGGSAASGIFGSSQSYKFTFVNHVTTNTFFTPTQSGAADACKLLGCSYQWTGSTNSVVSEMTNAMNSAITAGVHGIA